MSDTSEKFIQLYSALREKEGRVYTDKELQHLPEISTEHPHYREWALRKKSCLPLLHYLKKKQKPLHILEVGCGNGWLSHLLAGIPGSTVIGCDPGEAEIAQAQRVFSKVSNLEFKTHTFGPGSFSDAHFDILVFSASLQYFESLSSILNSAIGLLRANGEIHILDTPFYRQSDIKQSEENSATHFKQLGCIEMKNYYFRHQLQDLKSFHPQFLFRPNGLLLRLGLQSRPFPWICISKP